MIDYNRDSIKKQMHHSRNIKTSVFPQLYPQYFLEGEMKKKISNKKQKAKLDRDYIFAAVIILTGIFLSFFI